NPLLEAPALASLVAASGARVLVTLAPFPGDNLLEHLLPELARVASLDHLVLVNLAEHIPGSKPDDARKICETETTRLYGDGGLRAKVPAHIGIHDFSSALKELPGDRLLSDRRFSPEDRSSMFCTGGTTGVPKIAVRRHGNEVANASSIGHCFGY